jgi:hypothetical protein
MRFINSYYDYSPIDLAKFADAHRTELCSVAHCGLCKGQGRRRVALIECDDCQRLIPCEDALTVYVGPGEDRGDSIYRPMCKPCDELDVAHSDELERRVIEELELEDRAYWARVERRGR